MADNATGPGHPAEDEDAPAAAARSLAGFLRTSYRDLVRRVRYLGATEQEAHDAVCAALEDVVRNWTSIRSPVVYARRAVVSEFIQVRQRERRRLIRLVEGGEGITPAAGAELSEWEGREWVMQKIRSLPPRQRDAMACLVDGLSSAEAADVLGQTPAAVRQNWTSARQRLRRDLEAEGIRPPAPRAPGPRTQLARKEEL